MGEGYAPRSPGSVGRSREDTEEEARRQAELPDPGSRTGKAHYAGMTADDAAATFKRETLCVSCLCVQVCGVASGIEEPLVVVSRCLAYLPKG